MTERRKLVVVGAGGFGPEILWAARRVNGVHPTFDLAGFCDDNPAKRGGQLDGLEVLGRPEDVAARFETPPAFVCAVGNNERRAAVVGRLLALGWIPVTVIDPSVHVADRVVVGDGTYVGAGSILSPHCRIGEHVMINHHCSIGHDSLIEAFANLSPGVRVSGECVVGEGAMLGSNAVIAPGKRVGRFATLGASSFALTNVPDRVTAVGVPARVVVRKRH
jgi:sugar O-acyltransferase (sialic acid O-acetyltransferase NeuD family)